MTDRAPLQRDQRDIPRWKRWYHVILPALASCGLISITLGIAFRGWISIYLGAFCLGGLVRGLADPQIRCGGYR